jgi:NAD(P) transhydrogenase
LCGHRDRTGWAEGRHSGGQAREKSRHHREKQCAGRRAINTGTIPSKALREAVMHLTGAASADSSARATASNDNITIADLIYVSQQVIHHELDLIRDHFDRNNVELIWGRRASMRKHVIFVDRPDDFEVLSADFSSSPPARARAAGQRAVRRQDHFHSDGLLKIETLPKR